MVDTFVQHSNGILAAVNIVLVYFVFIQIREGRKPIISTKILPRGTDLASNSDVMVVGFPYVGVLNESNNVAKSIDVDYIFRFNDTEIAHKEPRLSHLNPYEGTKFPLDIRSIREASPELLKPVTQGDVTKYIPQESLRIEMIIRIRFDPLICSLCAYTIEDNYWIEWESLESCSKFEDHPVFSCWNKRSGKYYIYKLEPPKGAVSIGEN